MVVTLTHAIPALIIYYPVFLLAAAFIIKFRRSEDKFQSVDVALEGRFCDRAEALGWSCWASIPMVELGVAWCCPAGPIFGSLRAKLGCSVVLRMASNSFVAVVSIQSRPQSLPTKQAQCPFVIL